MPARPASMLVVPLLCMFACTPDPGQSGGGSETEVLTAATLGRQAVRPPREYLSESPYADASRALGRRLLSQCRACHTLNAGGPHMLGPNLHGLFGRRAGSLGDFDYSDALGNADFVWTPRALDAWLARPDRFLPGNEMIFPGVPHASDRAAAIAVLLEETSTGQ